MSKPSDTGTGSAGHSESPSSGVVDPEAGAAEEAGSAADDEQRVESSKYETTSPDSAPVERRFPADLGEDIGTLPDIRSRRIALMPQKPGILYAYWHLPPDDAKHIRGLKLRLGRLVDRRFSVTDEIPVDRGSGSWYFHIDPNVRADTVYLQIGRYTDGGGFEVLEDRGVFRTPRLPAGEPGGADWAFSAEEFESERARAALPQTGSAVTPASSPTSLDSLGRARARRLDA